MSVFERLIGQQDAVAALSSAVAGADDFLAGRPAASMTHAWLFTGPPGSGRSVAALAFAAALVCPRGGCGNCRDCQSALSGAHPDVTRVVPSGLSIGVREARELVTKASMGAVGHRFQVIVVEDADRLTEGAANALLKAIEEPPPRVVWLLCAPGTEDLLPTIRSRCRLVALTTPAAAAIEQVLIGDGISPELARLAAAASQGHVGRARRLATDPAARAHRDEILGTPMSITSLSAAIAQAGKLLDAARTEAAGAAAETDAAELADLKRALGAVEGGRMPRGSAGAVKDLTDRQKSRGTRTQRDFLDRALTDLTGLYRDVLALQLGAPVDPINADRAEVIAQLARRGAAARTLRRIDAIGAARQALERNANPQLALEAMMLNLIERGGADTGSVT